MGKSKKKEAPLYDENGRWVEEKGRWTGALRRCYRLHPDFKKCIQDGRVELPPKTLKDGSTGKKNQVRYKCADCGELFSQKNVQVDHKNPVCPTWMRDSDMSLDCKARRIFCRLNNLQVLCSTPKKLLEKGKASCHGKKSNQEKFIRAKWKELAEKNNVECWDFVLDKSEYDVVDPSDIDFINKHNAMFEKEYTKYLEQKRIEEAAKEERKSLKLLKLLKKGKR